MTLATTDTDQAIEQVLIGGDLSKLHPEDRVRYYRMVCESVGLNPFTRPFQYITLSGKLTLYATKDATEQLRKRDGVSVRLMAREMHADVGAYIVTAQASTADGRVDEATGAVSIAGLKGENLANALMKAETKAKRRVTLSICGLGMLDESETDSIAGARREPIDPETGEIHQPPPALPATSTPPTPVAGPDDTPAATNTRRRPPPAQPAQGTFIRALTAQASAVGLSEAELDEVCLAVAGRPLSEMSDPADANKVLAQLKAAKAPAEEDGSEPF